MKPSNACPECGTPLAPDAPKGLCPGCLLRGGKNSRPRPTPGETGNTGAETSGFVAPPPEGIAPHFPQLEIIELLGQGGMGAVYKARQTLLDRTVALKVLPPEAGQEPSFAERFTREARAMARLAHPNIVIVFEFGEVDGLYYLIMEYVDGVNLRAAIQERQISPEQALAVVPQICDALQYAHEEGIVHRDIKPENVLLDKKGRVKIADFGLAKLLGRSPIEVTLTASRQVMGTFHYMAPEQLERPLSVDHRADIYSLGVVFYELLTGELPLGRFKLPSEKARLDERLDEVVLKTLEREPEQRYQQASEVKLDVETISRDHRSDPPRPRTAPNRNGTRPWSLSFTIPNVYPVFVDVLGIAQFNGHNISLEFEASDGIARPGLKDTEIAVEDVVSVVFQPGILKHKVVIQTDSLRLVADVPGSARGRIVLHVDRSDREIAERFVAAVNRCLVGDTWEAAAPTPGTPTPRPRQPRVNLEQAVDEARRQLKGPALGLAATGVLGIPWLIGLAFFAFAQFLDRDPDATAAVFACLLAVIGVWVIVPAVNVVSLRWHGWAVMAVLFGLLPVSPIVLLSAPFAVWMLIVIVQPEIRAAFRTVRHGHASARATLMLESVAVLRRVQEVFSGTPGPYRAGSDQLDVAYRRVQGPALALSVLGAINLLSLVAVGIALGIAFIQFIDHGRFVRQFEEYVLEGTWFLWPSALLGFVMLLAGLTMKKCGSYWLALAGAIAALIPCSPAWILSAPFGVWALVVLLGPAGKAAFARTQPVSDSKRCMPPKPGAHGLVDFTVARRLVRGPAIGLLVVALLDFLPAIILFGCGLFEVFEHFPRVDWSDRGAGEGFKFGLAALLVHLPTIGLLMFASCNMRRLRLRSVALLASGVAMAPFHVAFLLGVPIGIWSLVLLMRRDVSAAFGERAARDDEPLE